MQPTRVTCLALLAIAVLLFSSQTSASSHPRTVAVPRPPLARSTGIEQSPVQSIAPGINITAPYDWYRFQGAQGDTGCPMSNQDCGPASVAMAIQFAKNEWVPISQVRQIMGGSCSDQTGPPEITTALDHWKVPYSKLTGMDEVRDAVNLRGHIVITPVDTNYISAGPDLDKSNSDSSQNRGRYIYPKHHLLVIKGFTSDNQWVITYDPDVFGQDVGRYWYSNKAPKGKDRQYKYSEVADGLAHLTNTAFEILEQPQNNFTGVVNDSNSQPVANATVVLSNNRDRDLVVKTGTDGRYSFMQPYTGNTYILAINGNTIGAVLAEPEASQTITVAPSSSQQIIPLHYSSLRATFVSTGSPNDQTGCSGNFSALLPAVKPIFNDYLTYAGLGVDLGEYAADTEMVFSISPSSFCAGQTYVTTDPQRAVIIHPGSDLWFIGWEDYNDSDFNDLVVRIDATPAVQRFLQSPVAAPSGQQLAAAVSSAALPPVEASMDHTVRQGPSDQQASIVSFQGYDNREPNPATTWASFNYDGNDGTDFHLTPGTPIRAAAAGTVIYAGQATSPCARSSTPLTTNVVKIRHDNGYTTEYWWLATIAPSVTAGAVVSEADLLGTSGTNGCIRRDGLHFVVRNPQEIPVDPFGWNPHPDAFWFSLRDPWQEYYAASGKDATNYPLWTVPTTVQTLVSGFGTTTVAAPSGQLIATFPSGVFAGPLRVDLEDTAWVVAVRGQHMFRTFSITGFTSGDRVVLTLAKPLALEFSMAGLGVSAQDHPGVYLWDAASGTWQPLATTVDAVSSTLDVTTTQLGTFAVMNGIQAPSLLALPLIQR